MAARGGWLDVGPPAANELSAGSPTASNDRSVLLRRAERPDAIDVPSALKNKGETMHTFVEGGGGHQAPSRQRAGEASDASTRAESGRARDTSEQSAGEASDAREQSAGDESRARARRATRARRTTRAHAQRGLISRGRHGIVVQGVLDQQVRRSLLHNGGEPPLLARPLS